MFDSYLFIFYEKKLENIFINIFKISIFTFNLLVYFLIIIEFFLLNFDYVRVTA